MTASRSVGLRHYLPEPSRLWICHAPTSWPGTPGFWLHLAERTLGRLAGGDLPPVEPPAEADRVFGLFELIPAFYERLEAHSPAELLRQDGIRGDTEGREAQRSEKLRQRQVGLGNPRRRLVRQAGGLGVLANEHRCERGAGLRPLSDGTLEQNA